jgi:hypothetical protein
MDVLVEKLPKPGRLRKRSFLRSPRCNFEIHGREQQPAAQKRSTGFFCRMGDVFHVFARQSSHVFGSAWTFDARLCSKAVRVWRKPHGLKAKLHGF